MRCRANDLPIVGNRLPALVCGAFAGGFTVAAEWAGLSGRFAAIRGLPAWGDARPLADVWWHFPIVMAIVFLFLALNPWFDIFD